MSRNQSKVVPSKFCNVCKQAGKSEREYTSHYTKSATIVTCPTLLAQRCGWCNNLGHTPKYCKILTEKKRHDELAIKTPAIVQPKPSTKPSRIVNKFDILDDSDDDIVEKKVEKKEEKKKVTPMSYSAMASKVAPELTVIVIKKPTSWAEESSDEEEEDDDVKFVPSYNHANNKLISAEFGDVELGYGDGR